MPTITKPKPAPGPSAGAANVPAPRLGSTRPDQMVSTGGLASKFWGTVERMVYRPRAYDKGKDAGKYHCAVYVDIRADDPELGKDGIVTEIMKVGNLNQWVPSKDGLTPAGASYEDYYDLSNGKSLDGQIVTLPTDGMGDFEGVYVLGFPEGMFPKSGTQSNVPNNTKWAQWTKALAALEFPLEKMDVRVDCFVGLRAFWTRLPFESKGGTPMELEEGQRQIDVLVPTELDMASVEALGSGQVAAPEKAATAVAKKTGTKATAKAAPAPAEAPAQTAAAGPAGESLDVRLEQLIYGELQDADDNTLHKTALGDAITKAFTGKERLLAITKAGDNKWLASDDRTLFAFDPDSGNVVLMPQE